MRRRCAPPRTEGRDDGRYVVVAMQFRSYTSVPASCQVSQRAGRLSTTLGACVRKSLATSPVNGAILTQRADGRRTRSTPGWTTR